MPRGAPVPGSPLPARIGRFAVEGVVGAGAFGQVYRAFDPILKRTVAVKVARPEQMHDPGRVERFEREARTAANLQHPNIVPVFDSGRDGPHLYIASLFVDGKSLDVALEERPRGERMEGARRGRWCASWRRHWRTRTRAGWFIGT